MGFPALIGVKHRVDDDRVPIVDSVHFRRDRPDEPGGDEGSCHLEHAPNERQGTKRQRHERQPPSNPVPKVRSHNGDTEEDKGHEHEQIQ